MDNLNKKINNCFISVNIQKDDFDVNADSYKIDVVRRASIKCKLYKNGEFFDMKNDILEENPLKEKDLDVNEKLIKEKLSKEVSKFPSLPILN